jgi:hypothetical protein
MICSIKFKVGHDFECLIFIFHLVAIPLLLRVEWTSDSANTSANLLKHCLTLTDKFTALWLPIGIDLGS